MTNNYTDQEIAALGPGYRTANFDTLWRAIGRLPFTGSNGPWAWRGISTSTFHIQSSLYRNLISGGHRNLDEATLRTEEQSILEHAREWNLGRLGTTQVSDLQLLALLQHHGVPTRLLDVTANPLTALWFACCGDPDEAGLLAAFNLAGYSTIATEHLEQPTYGSLGDPTSWTLRQALLNSSTSNRPFVLKPTFSDPRMAAQEGFFIASAYPTAMVEEYREIPRPVVDGMYIGPSAYIPGGIADSMLFEETPDVSLMQQALWAFEISPGMKRDLLPILRSSFNRSASTLFPDLDGFRDWRERDGGA